MKQKLPFVANTSVNKTMPAMRNEAPAPSKQEVRRQMDELKIKVTELAERHMDITMLVLKKWVDSKNL